MKDKEQTIIDGVDVAGCKYFNRFRNICHNKNLCCDCDKNQDCYYKQLARKTQECEQKEKELLSNEKIINKLMKEVDELKQECEKLKNQVDEDYNYYTTELKTLRDIISNKEKRNAALFLTSGRYLKALEEIEVVCLEDTRTFADKTQVRYDSLDDILDIINKAKGGYNVGF